MFVIIVTHVYLIHISHGSVETHLRCGEIYNNNQIIADCPQSVSLKEFWKLINDWRKYGQKESATFLLPTLHKE